jgi:3-isopropylmalate/(R)-2-methylmalate dehydratase large subunit
VQAARTLFDKIWDSHIVSTLPGGDVLLYIDRHFVLDLASNIAFDRLRAGGRGVRSPHLNFGIQDHTLSTSQDRNDDTGASGQPFVQALRRNARAAGVLLFDVADVRQGIVHVVGPETGLLLPGCTSVAGDSHSSTAGGLGALGFGIGTSEVEHVLATQTLRTRKPKRMRVEFSGQLGPQVFAKDLILHLIGKLGAAGGTGYAVEYSGTAIRHADIEARLTICNMSIEFGARVGMVAPDEKTLHYVAKREFAPKETLWDKAAAYWTSLYSDNDAAFDAEVAIDSSAVTPQVTWGTSPQDVISVAGRIPDPAQEASADRRAAMTRALQYMGLQPGQSLEEVRIDWAFIGTCTNSRLSDLQAAAAIVEGRKVAAHVRAMVVPGSTAVKRAAEALGLDRIFKQSGFEWHESACSLCAAANSDKVGPGERCLSTSNRNFEGRQGAGSRTHLASPVMVAAAAIKGAITDVRKLNG